MGVFGLAGFLSAWIYIPWFETITQPYQMIYRPGPIGGDDSIVAKCLVLALGFPVAMTMASLVAKKAGWFRHISSGNLWAGLLPMYLIPGPVLFLSVVSRFLLLIPCLAVAAIAVAYLLKAITPTVSIKKVIRAFCDTLVCSVLLCVVLFIVHEQKSPDNLAWNTFYISLTTSWGAIFGMVLAGASSFRDFFRRDF